MSRNALFARSMLMVVAAPLLVAALMVVAIRVALPMFAPAGAPWPPLRTSLLLAVNLVAVCWWFGASALLVASAARRRTIAAGTVLLAAAVLYLVNLVAEIWAPLRALALVSPFHYFNAPSLVTGNDERVLRNLAVLIGTAVIPTALGFWRFNRRDC